MKFFLYLFLLFSLLIQADDYKLGRGYKISDELIIGGYFSIDYSQGDEKRQFRLDDVAFLAYGDLASNFSYLVEMEAAPFYVKEYKTGESDWNRDFHYERIYATYNHSEIINVRAGKQITPIGYWNLEPINVLRDTSSNPMYSYKMFPKLLTGLDLFGYLDEDNTLAYHMFGQVSDDIDEDYINIKNDLFVGSSLEYEVSDEFSFGGAIAYYETKKMDYRDERDVALFQADAKYDNYPFLLQTEWAYTVVKDNMTSSDSNQFSGYAQGLYNFNMQHAIISRYEYFEDNDLNEETHLGILGYSYRPMPSISIKAEYQINSNSYYSKALVSFSVLF